MTSSWQRVEPNGRDADLEEGIEARVADPLWMLARQWQLGEFRGEDAASPIHARAIVETTAIASFRSGGGAHAVTEPFAPTQLAECRVEAEGVTDGPAAIALAAEAGLQFLRRLELAGLHAVRAAVTWRDAFPLTAAAPASEAPGLPAAARRQLAILARRGVDGRALAAATDAALQHLVEAAAPGQWAATQPVVAAWRAAIGRRFDEPGAAGGCWQDERLAYAFSVGVGSGASEVVLVGDGYAGGHLDWHDFRIQRAGGAPAITAPKPTPVPVPVPSTITRSIQVERLPTPVTYRGQPAPRWWEFEDRTVYLGGLAAGPADLARLIVAEFGTVFSDDWYVVPVTLPIGSLNRVTALEVHDVFGGVHHLAATAVNDHAAYGAARPWAFFELAGDDAAAHGLAPYLFLPPVIATSLDGDAVEDVTVVRDEASNLGWAIERTVELPTGRAGARRQRWQTSAAAAPASTDAPWRYRVQTAVPPWWIPLVPELVGTTAEVRLRRGRMESWADLDPALVGAQGRVFGVPRALRLYEEDVPRGGVQITRAWQFARGTDGAVHLWMGRRKRPGRGDRAAGLQFDDLDTTEG